MLEKKKKWANSLFIGLVIVGVLLSFPLTIYISEIPNSVIGKIAFAIAKFSGKSSEKDAVAYGVFSFVFLTNLLIWSLLLKPIEIFGKNFWKIYLVTFKSLNPRYKTTRFGWHYGVAKLLLKDMKEEGVQPDAKEYLAELVQKRLDKMMALDPDSPCIKEIAGEFYNIKTELGSDTTISSELKEWKELSNKAEEAEIEEEKEGKRSYIYAGVAIIFMVGIILIGMQEIFKKGAIVKGLLDIVMGLIGGPYVIKKCLPPKKKEKE